MKQIFPKDFLANTTEVFLFRHRTRTTWFVGTLLFFILLVLGSLPFIKVEVFSISKGIIRSEADKSEVLTIVSGKVIRSILKNNRDVCKGDTLIVLDNSVLRKELLIVNEQERITRDIIWDLEQLVRKGETKLSKLKTDKGRTIRKAFLEKTKQSILNVEKSSKELKRNRYLHSKGVISEKEFADTFYDHKVMLSGYRQIVEEFKASCQEELNSQLMVLSKYTSTRNEIDEKSKRYYITAPINGTLNNVAPIYSGSYAASGTRLADINSRSNLLIECYVNSKDIGMIRKEMKAKVQVDAFNYNQWGTISGSVIEISQNYLSKGSGVYFLVKCKMDKHLLQLKSGVHGFLKKGMTVNVHFFISKRSLWELLYDKMDDWFIPSSKDWSMPLN